jgi:opacity protein-like surface antigen
MTRFNWQMPCAAAFAALTAAAAPAAAQSPAPPRLEISANAGALTGASSFTESESFTVNAETETVTVDHGVKTAPAFNVGAAVRVVQQLWVGVQFAAANTKSSASITALVPHPLQFNAARTVDGTLGDVTHNEQNIHIDVMYALPLHAVDVKLMAGPTFFKVHQDFVSGITVQETYPFDTATFDKATTTQLEKDAVGFNAGVDISRALASRFAVGGLVRYSRADVKFDAADVGRQTVKAGGVEVTGGVRIRF